MDIKCPHCGTSYEVEKKDMFHYTKCKVCGNGFVVGADTSLTASERSGNDKAAQASNNGRNIGVRQSSNGSSHASRAAIPPRFANPQKADGASNKLGKKRGTKNKVVAILCVTLGTIIAAGAVAIGG